MFIRPYILFFFFAEIFSLAFVMADIGFFKTLLLWMVLATGGLWIIQHQGFSMVMKAQAHWQNGTVPVDNLFGALCLVVAGLLLIMPGFLGDLIAILLLIPFFRQKIRAIWAGASTRTNYRNNDDGIIEAEYVRVDEVREEHGIDDQRDERPPTH